MVREFAQRMITAELDELVVSFRSRPLDGGPYTFVWIDALTQKMRSGGRAVKDARRRTDMWSAR